ncbi:hypothetical protein [Mesorhizobium loti]|uniref:hypothetical protein n=1 Tax=Rhizobium loti TaxID=381 RepID=UPI0012DB71DF|nr:hypothetical protein [Mesorhizobium loti]
MAIRLRRGGWPATLPINDLKRGGPRSGRPAVRAGKVTDGVGLRSRQSPGGLIVYPGRMDELPSIGTRDFNNPSGRPELQALT